MVKPLDDNFELKVRNTFSQQKFMKHIGAKIMKVDPGYCEIFLPFRQEFAQQNNYFHGALIGTLADNAGGFAAFSLMPPNHDILTVEYKINLLAPGNGEALLAKGKVIKSGRTLTTSLSEVFVVNQNQEKLCATAIVTLISLPKEKNDKN